MATNKWLNDLKTLNSTTNILRDILRNGNVKVYDNDTLQQLVGKTSELAPLVSQDNEEWAPDALWVFPDPNGTGENKTIRQIYDEDTMASSYTYRGIYLIYGNMDSFDLKAVMQSRTNADTFITSDNVTYENVTDTSLIHTWNKDYDIVDSADRVVRYVRVYTKTEYKYIPGFYRQLIWAIHNLGTSITSTSAPACSIKNFDYERLECEDKLSTISGYYIGNPLSLVIKKSTNISNNTFSDSNQVFGIKWFDAPNATSFNPAPYFPNIRKLKVNNSVSALSLNIGAYKNLEYIEWGDDPTITSLSLTYSLYYSSGGSGYIVRCGANEKFYLTIPEAVKSITLNYLQQDSVALPSNLVSCDIRNCKLKTLILPSNLTTLVLENLWIKELTLPHSLTSVVLNDLYDLKILNVPEDFKYSLKLSSCTFLEHDSLVSILENLADLSSTSAKTLTLGSINLTKLSDEEKEIATNKNWTLA